MPILEPNVGETRTLPGPVRYITCQSGQGIVVDGTVSPPSTTVLLPDEVFEGEGKAGLRIVDLDGSRFYWESTLEAENRTSSQLVTAPDARPETDPRGEPVAQEAPDNTADPEEHPHVVTARGDSDSDSPTGGTGPYEDRTVPELKATAEKKGVDLEGATRKDDIIKKLRA